MVSTIFGPPTLIATDVDGTLIDDAERIGPLTRRTIKAAYQRGVPVIVATGRPPRWVPEIIAQLDIPTYAVCANGGIIFDPAADRVLWSATLDTKTLGTLVNIIYQHLPNCGLAAERVGKSAHDSATAPFVATPGYQHAWLNPDHIEVSDDDIVSDNSVKLLVRQPGTPSAELANILAPAVGSLADVTYSTNNGLVELSAPGVNKATGLAMLCEISGFASDASLAFGDMSNDIEMLRWATRGVAMANANSLVRQAANEITFSNNDDGVGRVLARWF